MTGMRVVGAEPMDRVAEWWTMYHVWASNLDSEGHFYIIAGSIVLVFIYAAIQCNAADEQKEYPKPK
jgi:hypothetical protein